MEENKKQEDVFGMGNEEGIGGDNSVKIESNDVGIKELKYKDMGVKKRKAYRVDTLSNRSQSVCRLLYEIGWASEDVLGTLFMIKKVKESQDKSEDYEGKRKRKFRLYLNELCEIKYVNSFGYSLPGDRNVIRGIFLTSKGYNYVKQTLRLVDCASIDLLGNKRAARLRCFDTVSNYMRFRFAKLKLSETLHHDYMLRLKIGIMNIFNKRVIMADYLAHEDMLYSDNRCDLLVDIGDNKFIGIEYEKSEKTSRAYTGYEYRMGEKTVKKLGVIRERQKDGFLPKPYVLSKVIIITENDNIFNTYMKYINEIATPNSHSGNYTVIDKFYLISRHKNETAGDLLQRGELTYCRKGKVGDKTDYIKYSFKDLFA